jgi:ribosomal protein S18 acetylase RimI-like enzyme
MAELEKRHPTEPHYYLAVLGTRPADRGRGCASATLAPVLERADSEGTGCYLESSKEDNVAFYARHGFEVTDTYDLAGGKGPRLWLMWREARPVTP